VIIPFISSGIATGAGCVKAATGDRKKSKDVRILNDSRGELSPVAGLADIPEQDIWLAEQKSKRTCRAYKLDVEHFTGTLRIRSYTELRKLDHKRLSNTHP